MGRRKERRLAAISAAGRRVKLDLFAEPSGDLGDSSAQEGVGGDGDSRTRTELPSSPSSSGQQPQNPLLLLEQYSDEELEDDVTEGQNNAVSQGTSVIVDKEAIDDASENIEDIENNDGKEHNHAIEQILINDGSTSLDPSKKHEEAGISGIDSDDLLLQQTHKMGETTNTSASDDRLLGVESSGWKMVLHEESNQYYYWNIVTGETSWEVPSVFTQETVTSVERADGCTEGNKDVDLEMDKANVPFDIEEDDMSTRNVGVESKVSCQNCEGPVQGTEADGSHEEFEGGNVIDGEEARNDANQNHGNSLLGAHSVENRCGTEFPSQLIKQCEGMLERLKSVKGFSCYTEDKDLKFKFMLEIEIRLADMKALASNGSSLITFWMHSEAQLKRLEAAVDVAIDNYHSVSPSGLEDEVDSSVKKDISFVEPHAAPISESSNYEAHDTVATEHLNSLYYSSTYADNDVGGKNEITVTENEGLFPARSTHSGEDVDMDVDMEVEDTSIVQSHHGVVSGSPYHDILPEPSSQHNVQAEPEASVPGNVVSAPPVEEWIPPPPPDSEPFPPPPPDDEPFPPPPPDEPPETLYTSSSHLGSVQSFTYPEQYSTSYPGSGLEYYGQTNLEISASTIYTHPDGGQVAVSHLPHYYEAVPNLYGVTPLVVNPVDSAAYYGPQSASLSHVPLISTAAAVETSITQGGPVPEIQDSTKQGPLDSLPQDGSSFLSKSSVNATESGHGTVKASTEVPNAQPAIGAPSTSMADDVSISSASDAASVSSAAAAAAAAAAASKAQSKVSRSKKRTVAAVSSLRSNKKVSTMVDKWKAVKEELQEEEKEEEPEDPYEILEKKRRREIEEWRAQLIASGEAKDNANFQPLGSDWRERVKRRRAERMKEKKQRSPDITPPSVNQQQQVDLVELSKGIPSGWQAYWDESSKQVYYGNVLTSETTWTKPAD